MLNGYWDIVAWYNQWVNKYGKKNYYFVVNTIKRGYLCNFVSLITLSIITQYMPNGEVMQFYFTLFSVIENETLVYIY